jgi:hypothetical protein
MTAVDGEFNRSFVRDGPVTSSFVLMFVQASEGAGVDDSRTVAPRQAHCASLLAISGNHAEAGRCFECALGSVRVAPSRET